MSPVFAARKRAEEFDSLVERTSTTGAETRYADLLELVSAMRTVEAPTARPEFVAGLRERLMTAAATELSPVASSAVVHDRLTVTPRRSPRDRRIAAAISGLALVGATTSMAVAAQTALPGDVLYPLKRAIENAHTGVSVGDNSKGTTLLANATGRLDEVDALARSASDAEDAAAIEATLADFAQQASEASDLLLADYADSGDERSITELRAFAAQSLAALDELAALIPDQVRSALVLAGNLLANIDAAAHQACPTCEGTGINRFPEFLRTASREVKGLLEDVLTPADAQQQQPGKTPTRPAPTETTAPLVEPTDGPVLPTPPSGTTGPDGSGQSDQPGSLEDLTDELLGTKDSPTATPSGGTSLGDAVTDVLDAVTGAVNDLTKDRPQG